MGRLVCLCCSHDPWTLGRRHRRDERLYLTVLHNEVQLMLNRAYIPGRKIIIGNRVSMKKSFGLSGGLSAQYKKWNWNLIRDASLIFVSVAIESADVDAGQRRVTIEDIIQAERICGGHIHSLFRE